MPRTVNNQATTPTRTEETITQTTLHLLLNLHSTKQIRTDHKLLLRPINLLRQTITELRKVSSMDMSGSRLGSRSG